MQVHKTSGYRRRVLTYLLFTAALILLCSCSSTESFTSGIMTGDGSGDWVDQFEAGDQVAIGIFWQGQDENGYPEGNNWVTVSVHHETQGQIWGPQTLNIGDPRNSDVAYIGEDVPEDWPDGTYRVECDRTGSWLRGDFSRTSSRKVADATGAETGEVVILDSEAGIDVFLQAPLWTRRIRLRATLPTIFLNEGLRPNPYNHEDDHAFKLSMYETVGGQDHLRWTSNFIYMDPVHSNQGRDVWVDLTPPIGITSAATYWVRVDYYDRNSDALTDFNEYRDKNVYISPMPLSRILSGAVWYEGNNDQGETELHEALVSYSDDPGIDPRQVAGVSEAFLAMNRDWIFLGKELSPYAEWFSTHHRRDGDLVYIEGDLQPEENFALYLYQVLSGDASPQINHAIAAIDYADLSWWSNGVQNGITSDSSPRTQSFFNENDAIVGSVVFMQLSWIRNHLTNPQEPDGDPVPWPYVTRSSDPAESQFHAFTTGVLVHELGHVAGHLKQGLIQGDESDPDDPAHRDYDHSHHGNSLNETECIMNGPLHYPHPFTYDRYDFALHYGCSSNPHFCSHHAENWRP